MTIVRSLLSDRRKKQFRKRTFIDVTPVTRVNTIRGKSPALYLGGYVLVLLNHMVLYLLYHPISSPMILYVLYCPIWFCIILYAPVCSHIVPYRPISSHIISYCPVWNQAPNNSLRSSKLPQVGKVSLSKGHAQILCLFSSKCPLCVPHLCLKTPATIQKTRNWFGHVGHIMPSSVSRLFN